MSVRTVPAVLALSLIVILVAACTGTQSGFSPIPGSVPPTASSAPSTAPSGSAAPSASSSAGASGSAGPSASASASASAPASPSASASASPSPSPSASPSASATASPSATSTAAPSPSGSADPYAGTLFECFGIAFPSEALLGEVDAPAAPSAGEFIRWLNEDADRSWPTDGWRLLVETGTGALYGVLTPPDSEPPAYVVTIRNRGEAWEAEDYGACTPVVKLTAEVGAATWQSADEIDASTTTFEARVTEVACSGGQDPEGRIVEPRITLDEDSITITFGETPLDGPSDCQSNRDAPYQVVLPEPVGDRTLRDGGVYPALDVVN